MGGLNSRMWPRIKLSETKLVLALRIAKEIKQDVANGESIAIRGDRPDGSKLWDKRPSIALGHLAGLRVCHKTIYNIKGPNRVHVFTPEAFERKGSDLPSEQSLWRYQDFWKFEDLLSSQSLHLSRLQDLADPLEGRPTDSLQQLLDIVESNPDRPFGLRLFPTLTKVYQAFYSCCFVNCWHIGDVESQAMWDLCESPRAIAIRTSVGILNQALRRKRHISTWKVHYVEYMAQGTQKADRVLTYQLHPLATHKDNSYRHEREFRIVHFSHRSLSKAIANARRGKLTPQWNARVPIPIQQVIREVRVHPHASDSFLREVREALAFHAPYVKVERSMLNGKE